MRARVIPFQVQHVRLHPGPSPASWAVRPPPRAPISGALCFCYHAFQSAGSLTPPLPTPLRVGLRTHPLPAHRNLVATRPSHSRSSSHASLEGCLGPLRSSLGCVPHQRATPPFSAPRGEQSSGHHQESPQKSQPSQEVTGPCSVARAEEQGGGKLQSAHAPTPSHPSRYSPGPHWLVRSGWRWEGTLSS